MNYIMFDFRWRIGVYEQCSARCGGGFKARRVDCIQDNIRDNSYITQRDSECLPPMPPRKVACNNVDCPPLWTPMEWGEVCIH